jgi:Icc protein
VIEDLVGLSKLERWPRLQALGDEAAAYVRKVLPLALNRYEHVVFLTHVPPLREACWHEGRQSDDHWAPHFTCKAVGDALIDIMSRRPEQRLTVLCGHTHGCGHTQPLPNIEIFTGGAEYCRPQIQRVFEFDDDTR